MRELIHGTSFHGHTDILGILFLRPECQSFSVISVSSNVISLFF